MSEASFELAIIGVGNIGSAIAQALVQQKLLQENRILLIESNPEKFSDFEECCCRTNCDQTLQKASNVLLAVKPQDAAVLAQAANPFISPEATLISIMAGVSIAKLQELFPSAKNIVRSMPNLPAQIGRGVTGYVTSHGFDETKLPFVEDIFTTVGTVLRFAREELMDVVVAVSGSGPGYIFTLMDYMIQTTIALGIEPKVAKQMIVETFVGSSLLAAHGEESPGELARRVTSKGGTTEAALKVFDQAQLAQIIERAITAAKNRADELNKLA